VTPANILVGAQGAIKLTDFGIARTASRQSVTRSGFVKGTVAYMSPEQSGAKAIDHRADLFSLGACLYEALTLSRVFPEGPIGADPKVKPVSSLRSDVPAAFDAVLARALAFDPAKRFDDASAMRTALLAAAAPHAPADERRIAAWQRSLGELRVSPAAETVVTRGAAGSR
jgi:serine/threonine protein kinase